MHRVINVPEPVEPVDPGGIFLLSGGGSEAMSLTESEGDGEGGMAMMSGGVDCGDDIKVTATRFEYAQNGAALTYVIGEEWCCQKVGEDPCASVGDYDVTFVREFRYDGARARYFSGELNPDAFQSGQTGQYTWFLTERWTDYDGVNAYRDRGLGTETGFEPGIGRIRDLHDSPKGDYYMADHLGTTRRTFGPSGGTASYLFTAFGEPRVANLDGGDNRYGYVGAHGYQAHDEMPFLHVGHRYYDPAIGRFLQRDPIGIRGGLNTFAYVENSPLRRGDPRGLDGPFCGYDCGCFTCEEVGEPSPPPTRHWPETTDNLDEARDTAATTAAVMIGVGVAGGPVGAGAAGLCIMLAYLHDYIVKYY